MALEPNLWGTLPKELLHRVFACLPAARMGQLRVLSKEWKRNIDCKDSEFNRVFNATTHPQMFALITKASRKWTSDVVNLYDMQAEKWHVLENNADFNPMFIKTSTVDGGLFCNSWQWIDFDGRFNLVVVNPLTQRKIRLPPLLSMGVGKCVVRLKMVKLTMDKKTKDYKVHVVGYMKIEGNGLFAQVYDSHINGWSLVESREGCIIGLNLSPLGGNGEFPIVPCVYNCGDGNLQQFYLSDIAPGLEVEQNCTQLLNDHLFVLHIEDRESNSRKYCISEFHFPENATAWVKLGVHKCDPRIYECPSEFFCLLACNGFLLVYSLVGYKREYNQVWLYNLSTCAWHKLPDDGVPRGFLQYCSVVMCEISWSALP